MKNIIILLLLGGLLSACKEQPTTPTDLLLGKNWRITAYSSTPTASGQVAVTDVYARLSACERDDFIRFSAGNTLVVDQGPLKCDPSASQTRLSSWSFNDDQTRITGLPTSYPLNQSDIVELSATTLRIRLHPSPYYNAGFPPGPLIDVTYSSF